MNTIENETKKQIFFTKNDKAEIIRSIHAAAFIQFIATIGSVIVIVKLMVK